MEDVGLQAKNVKKKEKFSRRAEFGKTEVGSRKSEVRSPKTEDRRRKAGYRIPDTVDSVWLFIRIVNPLTEDFDTPVFLCVQEFYISIGWGKSNFLVNIPVIKAGPCCILSGG